MTSMTGRRYEGKDNMIFFPKTFILCYSGSCVLGSVEKYFKSNNASFIY